MLDILLSWLSQIVQKETQKKTQKAKHAYEDIFCVSLFFRAPQASKEVSEPKELPDERWDSRKRCNSSCLFVCLFSISLHLLSWWLRKWEKPINRMHVDVTDSLIGWEAKMQHLLYTFRKESKDWGTFTLKSFFIKTLTEMSIENLFLSYVPEAASVQNFHIQMFV